MDLTNKIEFDFLRKNKDKFKKIFIYRICGTGMGACACLLKEKGYEIEGGDNNYAPPMSTYLESTGIPLHNLKDLDDEFYKQFDLIVVGNVVPKASSDARMIESLGIPFVSFPSALGALVLNDVGVIGISGTHGKTTTTYIASQIFNKLGLNPGHFIGGVIEGVPSAILGGGKYFFIESDEYDSAYFEKISKFRSYSIDDLILTSLEFDHADIFSGLEDIKDEFRALIPTVKGDFLFCSDYPAATELYDEFKAKVSGRWHFYGENEQATPKIINQLSDYTEFSVNFEGVDTIFKTNLVGLHNVLNLTSIIMFALGKGIDKDKLIESVLDLKLVKRRQEIRGSYQGAIVIDDFAHHPKAVKYTIDGIKRKFPDKKVKIVFAPNSSTARSDIFQKEFTKELLNHEYVIITQPENSTTAISASNLDCCAIIDTIKESGRDACLVNTLDELIIAINSQANSESVILVLNNGTCLGLWQSKFVDELEKYL